MLYLEQQGSCDRSEQKGAHGEEIARRDQDKGAKEEEHDRRFAYNVRVGEHRSRVRHREPKAQKCAERQGTSHEDERR